MPSSLRFLLFRIHLIGMTMSKDISFNSNNFSSNYFSRSFTFWSILIILIQFQIIANSVARTFLSEFADFCLIYRQNRQVFSPKSRKIRQFLPIFNGKIDPLHQKFRILLHFYALIFFEYLK